MSDIKEELGNYLELTSEEEDIRIEIQDLEMSKVTFMSEGTDIKAIEHNADVDNEIREITIGLNSKLESISKSKERILKTLLSTIKAGQSIDIEYEGKTYKLEVTGNDLYKEYQLKIEEK